MASHAFEVTSGVPLLSGSHAEDRRASRPRTQGLAPGYSLRGTATTPRLRSMLGSGLARAAHVAPGSGRTSERADVASGFGLTSERAGYISDADHGFMRAWPASVVWSIALAIAAACIAAGYAYDRPRSPSSVAVQPIRQP